MASRYFVLAGAFVCYGRAVVVTRPTSIVNWSQLAFAWWLRQLSLATVHVVERVMQCIAAQIRFAQGHLYVHNYLLIRLAICAA